MKTRLKLLFVPLFCAGLAAGAQTGTPTVLPTSPTAAPLRVMLELVNDPSAAKLNTYVAGLTAEIQSRWIALLGPHANQPLPDGQEALLSVTILPDGHPSAVKVMHKTQDAAFDKAAWKSITDTVFPPVPAGMPRSDLKLRVHFMVQLYPTQRAVQ